MTLLQKACVAATLLLLAGCAVGPYDPAGQPLKPQDGVVIVTVTGNTGEAHATLLALTRFDDAGKFLSQEWIRDRQANTSRDGALLVAALPAGHYSIQQIRDEPAGKYVSLSPTAREIVGTFDVKAGATSDLGRLVMTAFNTAILVGRSTTASNREIVQRFRPDLSYLYQGTLIGGWTSSRNARDFAEEFALAHPQGLTMLSELSTGDVLAGTRMGTIMRRTAEGRWKIIGREPNRNSILDVVPYETDTDLAVAVGDFATLVRVGRNGAVIPVAPGNLPPGPYFFVDHAPDASQWIVGVLQNGRANLYRSATLENGSWELVRSRRIGYSLTIEKKQTFAWRRTNGFGFSGSDDKQVACYDYTRSQWVENPTPEARSVSLIVPGAEDSIGLQANGGAYVSRDCGANWTKTGAAVFARLSPPLLLKDGTLLRSGGDLKGKGVYASTDQGASWNLLTDEVSFADRLWLTPHNGLFGITPGTDGIEVVKHSSDGGRTWTTELTSIDYAVLKAQREARGE